MKEKIATLLDKADAISPGTMLIWILLSVLITYISSRHFVKPYGPFKELNDDTLHD